MEQSFLQSQEWEKFQQKAGKQTFRLDSVLIIRHSLPRGLCWLYIPRIAKIANLGDFLTKLQFLARREKAIFCKIEPTTLELKQALENKYKKWRVSATFQPQTTLRLDMRSSEERLLEQMKPKTRYNIRLAGRHGIEIVEDNDIRHFHNLAQKTARQDNINFHPPKYYQIMLESLKPQVKLYSAIKGERVLAAAIILFWQETAYYLHGASDYSQRQLMAPYALHWEIIKQAKKRGYRWYDFYGVAVTSQHSKIVPIKGHSWEGITRFKLGFAPQGKVIQYPLAVDLIFKPIWYKIYSLVKKIK